MLQSTYRRKRTRGTQRRPPGQERDLQALSSAQVNLEGLSAQLRLVQAALLLVTEGTNRATVSEVAYRATEEFGLEVIPSVVGQAFSSLGVRTTTTHGRARLALEPEKLQQILDQLSDKSDNIAPQVEAAASRFQGLDGSVRSLERRLGEVSSLVNREQELKDYLRRHAPRGQWSLEMNVQHWEEEYRRHQGLMKRKQRLQSECDKLSRALKAMPKLEQRLKELQAAQEQHDTRVKEVDGKARTLAREQVKVEQRYADIGRQTRLVSLAKLDERYVEAKKELDRLSEELRDKRFKVGPSNARGRRRYGQHGY